MKTSVKYLLPLSALSVLVVAMVANSFINGNAVAQGPLDVSRAVPKREELPEFERYRLRTDHEGTINSSDVMTYRKSDGARLWVDVSIINTEAEAKKIVQRAIMTQLGPGPMPSGSPSGRKIGDECYHSNREAGLPQGSLQLITRQGRAVVVVSLDIPPTKDKGKHFVRPRFATKDVELVEKQTIKALDKLTKAG